jgi:hypothetical protein
MNEITRCDCDQWSKLKSLVLDSVTSPNSMRSYEAFADSIVSVASWLPRNSNLLLFRVSR